jgi:hypothetical protein
VLDHNLDHNLEVILTTSKHTLTARRSNGKVMLEMFIGSQGVVHSAINHETCNGNKAKFKDIRC